MNRFLFTILLGLVGAALALSVSAQPGSGYAPAGYPCDPIYADVVDVAHGCFGQAERALPRQPESHRASAAARTEANRALVRQVYADLARGDVPAVLAVLDEHVMWTEAEDTPFAGTFIGPETVGARVFGRIRAEWSAYRAVPRSFVADGNRVVVLGDYRATHAATGRSVRAPFAHVWQVDGDAVVQYHQFTDAALWQRALDF